MDLQQGTKTNDTGFKVQSPIVDLFRRWPILHSAETTHVRQVWRESSRIKYVQMSIVSKRLPQSLSGERHRLYIDAECDCSLSRNLLALVQFGFGDVLMG